MTKAIGIDFGTTYSSIYVYNSATHMPEGKKDGEYGEFIPTEIAYKRIKGTDQYYFGHKAHEKSNYVVDVKRMLGISSNSILIEDIKEELAARGIGIRSVGNEEGCYPREIVQLQLNPNSRTSVWHTPEELAARYFKWLVEDIAEVQINDNLKVVITIPADFSSNQRKAILRAAGKANFNLKNVTLLYEPSAAAFCYLQRSSKKIYQNLLVCDFGGGTFDLSLLKITENSFFVRLVGGNRFLGGRDFDQKLLSWAIAKFNDKGIQTEKPKIKKQLEVKCVKAKEELSSATGTEISIVYENSEGEECDEIIQIARDEFNNECSKLIEACINSITDLLSKKSVDKSDVDGVLLVGGSSRMPIFIQKMKEFFGPEKVLDFNNKREAIGMGACYLAAMKCNMTTFEFINNQNLNQRLPHTIGLQDGEWGYAPFFFKNETIPLPPKTLVFSTTTDNQENAVFRVFEGECPLLLFGINELVGEFKFKNLPKRKAGEVTFNISMEIDELGILTIKVNSPQAGTIDDYKQELDLSKLETFQMIMAQNTNAPEGSQKMQSATQNRELKTKAVNAQLKNNSAPRTC
ncbi:Heat shock protein ssb1 [Tritrichomonas musculus]|uniref:Heat shock protein ssb1 n=1 Tax=Tritrichomonas musculus TaxID=1915356 RepID=A0ABR2L7B7_9EUKA